MFLYLLVNNYILTYLETIILCIYIFFFIFNFLILIFFFLNSGPKSIHISGCKHLQNTKSNQLYTFYPKETQRRRGVTWTEEEHGYKIFVVFCFGGDVGFYQCFWIGEALWCLWWLWCWWSACDGATGFWLRERRRNKRKKRKRKQ